MKKTTVAVLALAFLLVPLASFGDDAAAIFETKCKTCHGPDGKKLAKADLASTAIQSKSDAELVAFLTTHATHKAKVADEATARAVVAFLRTLKK